MERPLNRKTNTLRVLSAMILATFLVCAYSDGSSTELQSPVSQALTPMLLAVHQGPVPFFASDGYVHLDYELWLMNFSSAGALVKQVKIIGDGRVLQTLDAADIARQLQPAGLRTSRGTMPSGTLSLLFIDVILPAGVAIPHRLSHEVEAHFDAAPPGHQDLTVTLDGTGVNRRRVAVIGPPLHGDNYISADSCCGSSRHRRASLPVDGAVWLAQRFAVDWEQLNAENRIHAGSKEALTSYTIYGRPVFAVAAGTVVEAINDQLDQPPGSYPVGLSLDQIDGNSVILDIGGGNYVLYAHMQRGSVRVKVGESVTRGEVIGLVGNSGNTIAPHLHFQLMSGPQSVASDGLPYEIDSYYITALSPGTEKFDYAEANGTPLVVTALTPSRHVRAALPLDQLIISFGGSGGKRQ